jgi:hypothetical protein
VGEHCWFLAGIEIFPTPSNHFTTTVSGQPGAFDGTSLVPVAAPKGTPAGNVLWDCIALIDDATVDLLKGLGGVAAIAISHPHYYTTMVEWSRALGGVSIHLHAADRQWVTRADPAVQFWEGDTKPIGSGLTLVQLGGHFDGGTVLHWADWSEGRGVLLSGDILQVVPSGHVSFMWSYPNLIPLSVAKVQRMARILEPFAFDAVYGAFSGRGQIDANGKQVVRRRSRAMSQRSRARDPCGAAAKFSHRASPKRARGRSGLRAVCR